MSSGETVSRGEEVHVLVVGESGRVDAATAALEARFDGPSIVTVPDAGTARDWLERGRAQCVVCDVSGDREGESDDARPSSITALRDATGDVPIVALVDGDDAAGAGSVLAAGATDVVRSDDAADVIVARVANAVDRYRLETSAGRDERYRSILEGSDALVVVCDETGTVSYVSPAIEAETGYTPDEVERQGVSSLVHPDDRDRLEGAFDDVLAGSHGTTARETVRLRQADGTWRVYAATLANRLADPFVDGVVATIERPTPADRVDAPLEDAVERLGEPFLSLGPDWEVAYANGSARAVLLGSPRREDPDGAVVWDLLPDSIAETLYDRCLEAERTSSVVGFELSMPGDAPPLEVSVHPSEAAETDDSPSSSGTDTGRVEREPGAGVTIHAREIDPSDRTADLRSRLGRFESALEALESGVLVLEESRVVYANRRAAALAGRDALVGLPIEDVFPAGVASAVRERARSPIVRRSDPLEATLEGDTGPTPVELSVVSPSGRDETVCVVRDASGTRTAERALSLLERTGRDLRSLETRYDVYRTVAAAGVDGLDCDIVALFRGEDDRFRPVVVRGSAEASTDALGSISQDAVTLGEPDQSGSTREYDAPAIERLFGPAGVRGDRALLVPVADDAFLLATATGAGRFDRIERAYLEALAATTAVGVDLVARDAAVRERERDLAAERSRADRLEGVLERLAAIDRRVARAADREAIERCAVEELATLEGVSFAWIGGANVAAASVEPRARAGDLEGYLETTAVDVDADRAEPAGRAVATRAPVTVEDVAETEPGPAWRREALERGIRSVYSVPLCYDDYLYGALSVYADRPAAFDAATRSALTVLGETVAHAINAVETRRALLSDRVTELELSVRGDEGPFSALAREVAGRIDVDSVVPRSDGLTTVFLSVPAEAAADVRRTADSLETVESVRRIGDPGDEVRFELVVDASSAVASAGEHGAVVRSIGREDGRTILTIELPRDADVRSFVEMLERKRSGVELLARRKRDRSRPTDAAFRDALRERLSSQQRRALETAYHSGFFEWPRERTGEEVAESLGVSQPTFNRHFRAAERKLFTLLFED